MSEFTICNYCRFEHIKRSALEHGEWVSIIPNDKTGWIDCFVSPEGTKDEDRTKQRFHKSSFMVLPDRCMC